MAGEIEEYITLKAESLPTGSISFGRFEHESLCWERRSSFLHNRYLEEVEKYSTPGSVTKKKEYFEAHFKKKALLCQVPEENQHEAESRHARTIIGVTDSIIEDSIDHGNSETAELAWDNRYTPVSVVPDEHEAIELQKAKMLTESSMKCSSFNNENFGELFKEPLNLDGALQNKYGDNGMKLDESDLLDSVQDKTLNVSTNLKKHAQNRDPSSKLHETKKKNEPVQMKTQYVPMESTVEQKIGKSQPRAHLPAQQMSKKTSRNSSSVTSGTLKKIDNQNTSAKVEKQTTSKVSRPSAKNGNPKLMASRNMKATASTKVKSEEGVRAKKVEANPRAVDRLGSDVRQPVNRLKLVSKEDDKQNPIACDFKSSERAEKRKEYNLKVEKRLHAKVAAINDIQAKTEVMKEAEIKQLQKSLNFKATPMPSLYHEQPASRVSGIKKASKRPTKSQEKSIPSPPSNRDCGLSSNRTIPPSMPRSANSRSSSSANRSKNSASLNPGNGIGRKDGMRTGVIRGIVSEV